MRKLQRLAKISAIHCLGMQMYKRMKSKCVFGMTKPQNRVEGILHILFFLFI